MNLKVEHSLLFAVIKVNQVIKTHFMKYIVLRNWIYNNCSKFLPCTSMRVWYLRRSDSRTRSKAGKLSATSPAASTIPYRNFPRDLQSLRIDISNTKISWTLNWFWKSRCFGYLYLLLMFEPWVFKHLAVYAKSLIIWSA